MYCKDDQQVAGFKYEDTGNESAFRFVERLQHRIRVRVSSYCRMNGMLARPFSVYGNSTYVNRSDSLLTE